MSISKRAFGVEGFKVDPRPVPTENTLYDMAPVTWLDQSGNVYLLEDVKIDKKKNAIFIYRSPQNGDLSFSIKLKDIDETPNQKSFIAARIGGSNS